MTTSVKRTVTSMMKLNSHQMAEMAQVAKAQRVVRRKTEQEKAKEEKERVKVVRSQILKDFIKNQAVVQLAIMASPDFQAVTAPDRNHLSTSGHRKSQVIHQKTS